MHTGLVGPGLRERHREIGIRSFGPYWQRAPELARAQTRAQKEAWGHAKWLALEAKLDPRNRAVWANQGERLRRWMEEQQAAGTWRQPVPHDPEGSIKKALARWRELLADPAYRAAHAEKVSAAKGGRVEVACGTCGTTFAVPRNVAAAGRRRFCSKECLRVFQRWWSRELNRTIPRVQPRVPKVCAVCGVDFEGVAHRRYCSPGCEREAANAARRSRVTAVCPVCGQAFAGARGQTYCSRTCSASVARARRQERPSTATRPEVRAKLSQAARRRGREDAEALRALPLAAFASLGEPERTITRLYFGLEDSRPRTGQELAARFGMDKRAIQRAVARSVARLLGRDADDPAAPSSKGDGGAGARSSAARRGALVTGEAGSAEEPAQRA